VDLATPLAELERLLAVSMIGAGLAIGSRDVVTSRRVARESAAREFLGRTYNRLARAVVTPGIYDTQCGAKVAAASIWRHVLPHTRQTGFAWDVELVAVAKRLNVAVWEVGVEWSHDERSRVRTLRDGIAMVADVAGIWRNVRSLDALAGDDRILAELRSSELRMKRHLVSPGEQLTSSTAPPFTLAERAV
jgi:dolichyl-phosphate beta-glucosyltransferase